MDFEEASKQTKRKVSVKMMRSMNTMFSSSNLLFSPLLSPREKVKEK